MSAPSFTQPAKACIGMEPNIICLGSISKPGNGVPKKDVGHLGQWETHWNEEGEPSEDR